MSDEKKLQPWKAMSSLEEDKNPDLKARGIAPNQMVCTDGASVSKPMDRKSKPMAPGK
jgi:hypothetical protein